MIPSWSSCGWRGGANRSTNGASPCPLALRIGLAAEQIEVIAAQATTNRFTDRQGTLLAITDELLARRAISELTWQNARATLTNRELIELCLLVGHYQGLATAIGGLAIEPETSGRSRDGRI